MRIAPALHRRTWTALVAALVASSLAWPELAHAGNRSFSPGSVIIPAQLEYQDGDTNSDGTIAAYGLVYTVLSKNKARIDAGKRPITFYWAVEARKLSHHRCYTPSDTLPDYSRYNDNDGCDFAVQSAAGQPVVAIGTNFAEVTNFTANGLSYSGGQVSRSGTFTIGASKKVVKYSGGAWIVDATDRNDFLLMLQQDPQLAHFHKNGPGRHYVKLHSAQASFEANIQRAINQKPPLLAIVGKGSEQILTDYLDQAGLTVAFGSTLGGTPSLPGATDTHGTVYDVLDPLTHFVDTNSYPCGAINMPADPNADASSCADVTVPSFYRVLWAADWKIDSASTYPDEWKGRANEADAKANALANISMFVDRGNGLFAEDSSIVTFEGIAVGSATTCSTVMQCFSTTNTSLSQPFSCPSGSTPSRCDGGAVCYSCPAGQVLDDSTCPGKCLPQDACPSGYQLVNGACYQCGDGYTLNTNNQNALACVPNGSTCPTDYTAAAGSCYQCPKIGSTQYLLDTQPGDILCYAPCGANQTWDTTINKCVKNNKAQTTKTVAAMTPPYPTPTMAPAASSTAATKTAPLACPSGYALSCGPTGGVVEGGSDDTRFQTTAGATVNSISGSFSGADCNDYGLPASSFFHASAGSSGSSCVDYHPEDRVPALLFSQKGNFNFTSETGGNVQDFTAKSPSLYRASTWQIVSSARVDSAGTVYRTGTNAGLDFATMRHKDGDPTKGLVVYLAGHQYKFDFWGLRIILNTLLNLGLSDAGTELARSEPVGFRDVSAPADGDRDLVFQGTYTELPPPLFDDWVGYSPVAPEAWRFPYTTGHLRAYRAGSIALSGQDFVQNKLFDAAAVMPAPGARNIFTFLGGSGKLGWHRVTFNAAETGSAMGTSSGGACSDFNGNDKCDLSEKLAEGNTAGVTPTTLPTKDVAGRERNLLGMFVQQVRGFCAAFTSTGAPIFEPTSSQCRDYATQKNVAILGGIDHSSPAVVGPSRLITTGPNANRPVVAYVGGRDGMLHAFYVGGGSGFAGLPTNVVRGQELWAFLPPGQIPWLATNNAMVDAAVNVIDVFGDFPVDRNGDGVIDWSPESNEHPDGLREWRTVLLGAAGQESKNLIQGQGGLELFALDVTDPMNPVLLWHVTGISERDGRWDANRDGVYARSTTTGAITELYDDAQPQSYALLWRDWGDFDNPQVNNPAKYDETDPTRLRSYHTGRYDYSNLGFTYGTSIGKVWTGTAYQYLAYIVTSAADFNSAYPTGYAGIDVFGIDLITGEKVWQWQKRYSVKTATEKIIAANDIPGRPALADVDSDGSVDRIYVSDLEGRMWELSALDGRNLIYWPVKGTTKRISLPLFGTPRMVGTGATDGTKALFTDSTGALSQQPLTSPIGLGRFSDTKAELKPYLVGRLSLVEGSMGVNWALAPFEKGNVFVLPSSPEAGTRMDLPADGLDLGALTGNRDPRKFGVLHRGNDGSIDAAWRIELGVGERVYGMPRIVNNKVVFDTAFGDFTGDQLSSTSFDQGNLVVATKDGNTSTPVRAKSFAGVLIFGDNVIVTSATGIMRFGAASQGVSEGGFATRPFNRNTPATMKTWELQAEITAPDLR